MPSNGLQLLDTYLLLLFIVIIGSSCDTTKYLAEDERLLTQNTVKFIGKNKIQDKSSVAYDLTTLYKQPANTNFFFLFPREKIYYKTQGKTNRIASWRRRVLAEKPAIFNEDLAVASAESMTYYLQNKGYFNAEVYPEYDDYSNKKTRVTYMVNTGSIFTIDSTNFVSRDSSIQKILNQTRDQSLLKPGTTVDGTTYEQESARITSYLRNHGYAYFYPNSIAPLEGDSTGNKIDVRLEILPPASDTVHKQYYIGNIFVFPDYSIVNDIATLKDSLINGVHFLSNDAPYRVRASVLRSRVFLENGALYRQEDYDKTNRALGSLGTYKFVSIKQEIDPLQPNKLNFFIYLTRNKQLEFGIDFDINSTNQRNTTTESLNLVGVSISPSIRNRNIFGGAELLISRAEAGLEMDFSSLGNNRFYNTVDIRISNELYIPKFVDYLGIWRTMNKLGKKRKLISDDFLQVIREKASTRIALSYNLLDRLNFFRYNLFNASFGYDLQKNQQQRYLINHVGIDILLPTTDPAFDAILAANPFLARSFGKQLFTSLLFRDFSYIFTGRPNRRGQSFAFTAFGELSGSEVWLTNKIYNAFSAQIEPDTFRFTRIIERPNPNDTGTSLMIPDTINFAQYAKLQLDGRLYKKFNPKNTLAIRLLGGIGTAYGFSRELPYVKQFFVGGPNSMRGWNVRGLGPGSYVDTEVVDRRLFYQTGDLRLELNLEYRFDIFKIFSAITEGAFFIDAGNIWTIGADGREGGQFLFKAQTRDGQVINEAFYQQIAIASGFGVRFDLSYFIFRFDMGYPLRYPSLSPQNGNRGFRWQQILSTNRVNYSIALGYPF